MSVAKRLILAGPRGFCAGVRHAVDIVDTALRYCQPPIYCLKELVHNAQVVHGLTRRGVRFVAEIESVPRGACVLFSAHGVPPPVRRVARQRKLQVLDATCPFVTRLHNAVRRHARDGCHVVLVGNRQHDEVIGVCGEAAGHVTVVGNAEEAAVVTVPDARRVAALSQTTLDVEATRRILDVLRARFPMLRTSRQSDICFATHHRQKAARDVARQADLMLVLGSPNSSNTQRLVEVCRRDGCAAELIHDLADVVRRDFSATPVVGLTAGASTPDSFVGEVVDYLRGAGFTDVVEHVAVREDLHFPLPRGLRRIVGTAPAAPGRKR